MPNIKTEINDVIRGDINIDDFISNNFEPINSFYKNPIAPYKVEYKSTNDSVMFCNHHAVESWAVRSGSLYTFFVILKTAPGILEEISSRFGHQTGETEVEMDNRNILGTTYYWQKEKANIILQHFSNVQRIKKYSHCSIVVVGNIKYKKLFLFRPK